MNKKTKAITGVGAAAVIAGMVIVSSIPNGGANPTDRLLVKFYDGVELPATWPKAIKPTDSTEVEPGWDANMSTAELAAHKATHLGEYMQATKPQRDARERRRQNEENALNVTPELDLAVDAEDPKAHIQSLSDDRLLTLLREVALREIVQVRRGRKREASC